MKKLVSRCALAIAAAFVLPVLLLRAAPAAEGDAAAGKERAESMGERAQVQQSAGRDGEIMLRLLKDGEVVELSMAEYLPMALAGEMPANFHGEALKAQAVALRSYVLHQMAHPKSAHPQADMCVGSACCAAALDEAAMRQSWGESYEKYLQAIKQAVESTDGQYLSWEGESIAAVFHSCSEGFTEASENVWSALPYLQSVSSPESAEDVRSFISRVELSAEEFRATLLRSFPGMSFPHEPALWLEETELNSSGRVGSMSIAGREISGLALRQLFSLRSTDFSLQWDGSAFVFTVAGYGHGVGLSQYGADAMAREGADYGEILAHYYPGTELCR